MQFNLYEKILGCEIIITEEFEISSCVSQSNKFVVCYKPQQYFGQQSATDAHTCVVSNTRPNTCAGYCLFLLRTMRNVLLFLSVLYNSE